MKPVIPFKLSFFLIVVLMEVFSFSTEGKDIRSYVAAEDATEATTQGGGEEEKVVEISLRDALGQTLLIGFEGTEVTPELAELIVEIRPGGILLLGRNIENAEQTRQLIADLQEFSFRYMGIPLFVAVDQEGRPVTRVTWAELQTAQAELESFNHAYQIGAARARELKDLGFNMNLAPVLDSQSPDDYLSSRSFQGNSEDIREVARGLVLGHEKEKVLVVPKHFPGYDDVSFNPENNVIPEVSELPSIDVFQDVFFSTNQQFIMVAHVIYESVDPVRPFPFSKVGIELIRDVLSRDIVVMSDDLTSEAIIDQYNVAEIGARSLAAGVDILLLAGHKNPGVIGDFYEGLVKLVEQDEYLQAQVAASAQKIIQIKKTL
ncbi:glycoside hydrolase family 3 protein [Patescibacteria group bacterium]|nr:glycoside hydrolase family 3 protein [Patescibacteria group bacterium]